MSQSRNFYFIYIDESYDTTHYAYSAVFINAFEWNHYLNRILQWRKEWYQKYQIPMDYELHATNFIGGRGEHPINCNKDCRAKLFYEAIGFIETIDNLKIINAITPSKQKHLDLFDWMLNRIFTTLEKNNAFGVLICDEGNENKLTSLLRKKKKQNHIPSAYDTQTHRNIPLHRIVEDPLFKTSKSSYFIQLADFLAFSLLRNEKPIDSTRQPVKEAFNQLDNVLIKEAFTKDPKGKGIIRVK